ncbi:fused MFS/spermidine synthase [Aeromicrobium sp. CTD01-1L150]|uniref:fused MFS/spermidine synthase n=1 Tax=Aeromicrobium sp. CTD01-1L150 TaxID=3341830 RepID=UPI0035BEDD18
MTTDETQRRPALSDLSAALLVFGSSAAVLVVELVALRLLAPYLGLTLETSTTVIGIALAAIALGSWAGGQAADRVDPRRTIGPLLAVSGVAAAATPFVVRGAAELDRENGLVLVVAAVMILVPGALLSAVTPMVTKLMLTDLGQTGTIVGRLSGIGTVGAIVGTVVTGFVLISVVRVSTILVGLGLALVIAAVVVEVRVRGWRFGVLPAVLVLGGGLTAAVAPGGCDVETTYHCVSVVPDPQHEGGRTLVLDGLRHSYVDLTDASNLEFEYIRAMAAAIDSRHRDGTALQAYHLGGGGLTLPQYLREQRPGTRSLVSEIDGGVLRVDTDLLGARTGDDLEVRVEDGRLGLGRLPDGERDLVVGDAFGGVSVPWHLTTREALVQVHRVLRPGGTYAVNLIDYGDLGFARSAVRTLQTVFENVVVLSAAATFDDDGHGGGNLVAVASDGPVDADALRSRLEDREVPWVVEDGGPLQRWIGDARVLVDDFAPVDQLLTPSPPRYG